MRKIKAGTGKAVLSQIKGEFPLKVLRSRELDKLLGTYLIPFQEKMDARSRLHGLFNQSSVVTGRLSSSNPNLQNISHRTKDGHKLRNMFIADHGLQLIVADYSQIELRLLAHFSQDRALIEAFNSDEDIHTVFARKIFGVQEPTKEQRFIAKTTVFATLYGATAKKLGETICTADPTIRMTETIAQGILDSFYKSFNSVREWKGRELDSTFRSGYVSTLCGRIIPIPEIRSRNQYERWVGERHTINYKIQGSAADIMKLALLQLVERLPYLRLVCTVHDEVVVESDHAEGDLGLITDIMEHCYELNQVPLKVEASICTTWGDKK